jgi:hypothetical protein
MNGRTQAVTLSLIVQKLSHLIGNRVDSLRQHVQLGRVLLGDVQVVAPRGVHQADALGQHQGLSCVTVAEHVGQAQARLTLLGHRQAVLVPPEPVQHHLGLIHASRRVVYGLLTLVAEDAEHDDSRDFAGGCSSLVIPTLHDQGRCATPDRKNFLRASLTVEHELLSPTAIIQKLSHSAQTVKKRREELPPKIAPPSSE